MKIHSNDLKNNIKRMGKVLRSKLTYTLNGVEIEIDNAMLNSITPSFQSGILKSVMKQLDIDSGVFIPEGTIVNYQLGVKVANEFEYLNYGNYIVYKVEKQEDTKSWQITCYDKMLFAMKEYENTGAVYPLTVREYIDTVCTFLGLTFKNREEQFANYDKVINEERYIDADGKSLGYTFRDVFDELAQVTASTICINENDDELEIRYITDTNDEIDEEFLKDINVKFGEKYGKVNSIVLSRAGGSDNVYLRDEESVAENGLCEIKITDNQIMNFNDRSDYLPDILEKLNGLEYYINDFSSTGICYYEICDRYNVRANGNVYSCVMFNDEVLVTTGLQENINTPLPKESVTDYTKADKTDRKINQTYLIVDKQNGIIQSLVDKTVYVSDTKSGVGSVTLENAYNGQLYKLSIKGQINLLFPQSEENIYGYPLVPSDTLVPSNTLTPSSPVPYGNEILYPSNELFTKSNSLLIDDIEYKLDLDFLNYISNTVCDEFVYNNGECQIIRRVGIDSEGNKYALENEIIEPRKGIALNVYANSIIRLKSFDSAIYNVTYLLDNEYTQNFATQVEVSSSIEQTADSITEQVKAKVGDDEIIAKLNLAIKDGQGIIQLTGNQVVINSDHFKVDGNGNLECENANVSGTITSDNGTIGGWTVDNNGLHNQDGAFIENDGYSNVYTVVDIYILTAMLRGDVPWIPMPQPGTPEFDRYDINKDGVIDMRDLVILRRKTLDQ